MIRIHATRVPNLVLDQADEQCPINSTEWLRWYHSDDADFRPTHHLHQEKS